MHLGCVASYQDVKIIPAVMKILDAAGIDFTTLGKDENCCGYLAYLVGDMDTFHTVAAANERGHIQRPGRGQPAAHHLRRLLQDL